jgi:hypothetical protein
LECVARVDVGELWQVRPESIGLEHLGDGAMTKKADGSTAPLDKLLSHHRALIQASAISESVATERGYRSVTVRAELKRLGFSEAQCRVPALLVPIYGVTGELVAYQIRPDEPRVGKNGKLVKYETPKGSRIALDVPRRARVWLGDPNRPLVITEGARKADAGVSADLCTVALLGVWNWRGTNEEGGKVALADWDSVALNGRDVLIAFDSDAITKLSVHAALKRLKAYLERRDARVQIIYLPPGSGGMKVGLDDFFGTGGSVASLMMLASATPRDRETRDVFGDDGDCGDDVSGDAKTATLLLSLVLGSPDVELFHTPGRQDAEAYASIKIDGHRETWAIRSSGFRYWLIGEFRRRFQDVASSSDISDALNAIAAEAIHGGAEHRVAVRLAEHNDAIWFDLCDEQWRAVKITAKSWSIVAGDAVDVRFIRRRGMEALPEPVSGGSVRDLRPLVNVRDQSQWVLLLSVMVAYIRPRGPYPVLVVSGEQGSAKSTLCRFVRALIDPNSAPTRRLSRDDRDLMITASNSWIVAADNVSSISQAISDALCSLATRAGFATRLLYSDDDEKIFDAVRPIVINGIGDIATKADLLDRAVILILPAIPKEERFDEKSLEAGFLKARPGILGALLDAVVVALRNVGDVRLDELPRMADFAIWATAAEPAFGHDAGTFLKAYAGTQEQADAIALECSSLGSAIASLMNGRGDWSGSAAVLLNYLELELGEEFTRKRPDWPKSPNALGTALRGVAPNLRRIGIEVTFVRQAGGNRGRIIRLAKSTVCDTSSPSSRSSHTAKGDGESAHRQGQPRDVCYADSRTAKGRPAGGADATRDEGDERDNDCKASPAEACAQGIDGESEEV